jgi:hypothetical protein
MIAQVAVSTKPNSIAGQSVEGRRETAVTLIMSSNSQSVLSLILLPVRLLRDGERRP